MQTLQAQNKTLSDQVTSLTNANTALKAQVVAAAAEKQALEKRVTELEARIAELTKTASRSRPQSATSPPACRSTPPPATKRSPDKITTLAIHHSAAAGDIPPQNIAAYHVRKGWPGIGYHYYIIGDGTIYQCNTMKRSRTMLATRTLIQWASAWQAVLWTALNRPRSNLPLLRTSSRTCHRS